jgi:hypothetical protein
MHADRFQVSKNAALTINVLLSLGYCILTAVVQVKGVLIPQSKSDYFASDLQPKASQKIP